LKVIKVIDFPQAVDKRNNEKAMEILNKDLTNIVKFFSKFIKIDIEDVKNFFITLD